jgi:hypothetical protein
MINKEIYFIASGCLFFIVTSCGEVEKKKYFTGIVEYRYSYTSDSLNVDSLVKSRPSAGFFRYDENSYQSKFIGKDTATYYYSGLMNKCIAATGNPLEYSCEDYGVATDSVLAIKIYDTDEKVLGYNCKILEMQKMNSSVNYYVSTELKIAPSTYKAHKAYNWDMYGEKTKGGLILKLEHRFKSFSMSGIAKNIIIIKSGFKAHEISDKDLVSFCKE